MQALPAGGAMLAVALPEARVAKALEGRDDVAIATVNGPRSIVVSGAEAAVEELRTNWSAAGLRTKRLTVSHAFHSPLMDPMLDAFAAVVAGLSFAEPVLPGLPEGVTDPAFWVAHVREAVRWTDEVERLQGLGVNRWLELGPDAILTALNAALASEDLSVPALRAGQDELLTLFTAVGTLWAHGTGLDWAAVGAGWGGRPAGLPTYPFQHERFWPEGGTGVDLHQDFWDIVRRQDLGALASTLGVEPATQLPGLLRGLSSWYSRRHDDGSGVLSATRPYWRELPEREPDLAGTWLLVAPPATSRAEWTRRVRRVLARQGAELVELELTETPDAAAIAAVLGRLAAPGCTACCPWPRCTASPRRRCRTGWPRTWP